MSRNAHGVLVCTGFESKEDVAEREQKYKIQRIRDSPGGNQWIGQLKIKAIETGVDAIFIIGKDIDTIEKSIKTKYPDVTLPVLSICHDWDYDTKLVHYNKYLQDIKKLEGKLDDDPFARQCLLHRYRL